MANLRADNLCGTGGRNAIDGSVFFDGGSSLTVADNSGYEFGTGDFTIECWINASDLTHERHLPIIQKGNSATNNLYDWRLYFNNHGSGPSILYFDIACSGTTISAESTGAFAEDAWNHVAVTRQSGAFKVFFNGILEDTDSTTANAIDDDYTEIKIGFNDLGSAGDSYLKGYISNLRIIKGTALYTASFTPPTEKLTAVAGTTLLCCQSSSDVTEEAAGKTITSGGTPGPKATKITPSVGVDAGVVFDGGVNINSQGVMYFPTGDTSQRSRGRALVGGGSVPGNSTAIDYFEMISSADCVDFGDLTVTGQHTACSSATRGVFAMGSNNNTIDYVTITTTGNATDFGDRTVALNGPGALASNVRGVFTGGGSPSPQSDVIDYITIASAGNATDFGNMSSGNKNACGLASPTRGCIAHGGDPFTNVIDYITIATTGNATDFGDTVQAGEGYAGSASNTRGVWSGGYVQPANQNVIQYITIASTGNATNFGDLDRLTCQSAAGTSNGLRGFTMGGFTPSPSTTATNTMDYVTIASTGNSNDFGDLTSARAYIGGCSDSHGGIE